MTELGINLPDVNEGDTEIDIEKMNDAVIKDTVEGLYVINKILVIGSRDRKILVSKKWNSEFDCPKSEQFKSKNENQLSEIAAKKSKNSPNSNVDEVKNHKSGDKLDAPNEESDDDFIEFVGTKKSGDATVVMQNKENETLNQNLNEYVAAHNRSKDGRGQPSSNAKDNSNNNINGNDNNNSNDSSNNKSNSNSKKNSNNNGKNNGKNNGNKKSNDNGNNNDILHNSSARSSPTTTTTSTSSTSSHRTDLNALDNCLKKRKLSDCPVEENLNSEILNSNDISKTVKNSPINEKVKENESDNSKGIVDPNSGIDTSELPLDFEGDAMIIKECLSTRLDSYHGHVVDFTPLKINARKACKTLMLPVTRSVHCSTCGPTGTYVFLFLVW